MPEVAALKRNQLIVPRQANTAQSCIAAYPHRVSMDFMPPLHVHKDSLHFPSVASAEGQSRDDQMRAAFCGADLQSVQPVICVYPSLRHLWRGSIASLTLKDPGHRFLQVAINVPRLVQHLPDATPGLLVCKRTCAIAISRIRSC